MVKFLLHLRQISGSTGTWKIQCATDNQGLVTAVNKSLSYDEPFPNVTLDADYDIVHEIVMTCRQTQLEVLLTHVKGHQNKRPVKFDGLPIPAQLNIEADELAHMYRTHKKNTKRPHVPMLQHTRCLLHSNDSDTITRAYRQTLRNLVTTPAIRNQMVKSFRWKQSTIDLVDWSVFQKCRSKMTSQFQQMTKLGFDILPTAAVVAKGSKSKSDVCPLCETDPETNDHLCQCSALQVRVWRSKTIEELTQLLTKRCTQQDLGEALIRGIISVFQSRQQEATLDCNQFPRSLHQLIADQNQIGWRQLFWGRVSVQWAKLQQAEYDSRLQTKKNLTGTTWITEVVCLLSTQILGVWKQRNDKVFGNQSQYIQHSRHDKALQELRMIHAHRAEYRACDVQFLMTEDSEDDEEKIQRVVENSKIGKLEGWIHRWIPYFSTSIKKAKAQPKADQLTPRIRGIFLPLRRRIWNIRDIPPEDNETPTRRRNNPNSLTKSVVSFFTAWRRPTQEG